MEHRIEGRRGEEFAWRLMMKTDSLMEAEAGLAWLEFSLPRMLFRIVPATAEASPPQEDV
jgi:hypothetical protein